MHTLANGNDNTIGYCYKLATTINHLELRRNMLSRRVAHHWNKLPEDVVVNDITVNTFKNRLDKEQNNQSFYF